MKLKDLKNIRELQSLISPRESVKVYQIIELFDVDGDGKQQREQSTFVLASSLEEALKIVGKDERREVIFAKELCPITQLPDDIYRPMLLNPHLSLKE